MSILEATHRDSERSSAADHFGNGKAAAEDEAEGAGAINRTAPIAAVGTDTDERTIAEAAVARRGQFKRGGKGPCCFVAAPT